VEVPCLAQDKDWCTALKSVKQIEAKLTVTGSGVVTLPDGTVENTINNYIDAYADLEALPNNSLAPCPASGLAWRGYLKGGKGQGVLYEESKQMQCGSTNEAITTFKLAGSISIAAINKGFPSGTTLYPFTVILIPPKTAGINPSNYYVFASYVGGYPGYTPNNSSTSLWVGFCDNIFKKSQSLSTYTIEGPKTHALKQEGTISGTFLQNIPITPNIHSNISILGLNYDSGVQIYDKFMQQPMMSNFMGRFTDTAWKIPFKVQFSLGW
jgi:hypothetical protein